jgi:lauroyl/myristoyl acyltransferase
MLRGPIALGSRLAARTNGQHLQNLRDNLSVAAGRPADDRLVAAALRSYLRTLTEVLALPRWRPDEIVSRVHVPEAPRLRRRCSKFQRLPGSSVCGRRGSRSG